MPEKKKRAPGAGRPPKGQGTRQTKTLRLAAGTRAILDALPAGTAGEYVDKAVLAYKDANP